ncbi:MAG: acetylglutamate kinase [Acidobacteria bacterium]|nr:acetylglutamate kinase [Acidobacteriota bacterium]
MKARGTIRPVVLKVGGELLDDPRKRRVMARAIVRVAASVPLVVVHGGGREIDAALANAQIPKRQVDGLRITDQATLGVVVAVLAGSVNTTLVAAVNAAGGRAVGLTGADADVCRVGRAPRHRTTTGELVDLGLVGRPVDEGPSRLVATLVRDGFVPIVASIGAAKNGTLFNVNADTLAGSLATRLAASRLVIAGGTAGVLDESGQTIPMLDRAAASDAVQSGTISAGMVAKLSACHDALAGGVSDVIVADGTRPPRLASLLTTARVRRGAWTQIVG